MSVVGVLLGILLAALVYWVVLAVGLPSILAVVAAVLVFIALAFGGGGYVGGGRW